jgi:uncharacterized Zn-binding protein involved in type VI secretion
MPVTVNINGLSVVHQGSDGVAMATVPDVCNTPSAGGPIPVPYPNVAMSADLVGGTTSVTMDGSPAAILGSKFIKSTGDEAGVAGGLLSGVFAMEATFLSFSPTVMLDGKPACRLTDKMLMNKGNTVCMGGELQSFLPPAPPPPMSSCSPADSVGTLVAPEAPKRCVLRSVIVQCGHSNRHVQLDLAKHDVKILQVISKASEPDKLTVEWDGECGFKHPYCPTVGLEYKQEWKPVNKATAIVELPAPSWILVRDWTWIFKVLALQKDMTCDYRTLHSRLCMGHGQSDVNAGQWLQVQVFPEVEWNAEMTIGFAQENAKDAEGTKNPFVYNADSTWTISFSGEAKYGTHSCKCILAADQLADGLPIFGSLLSKIGMFANMLESMASRLLKDKLTVKFEPRWPKWRFGGGLKLVELPGKPLVGTEGNYRFGFDPLFGITFKISILDWLIAAGKLSAAILPLSLALEKVRALFKSSLGNEKSVAQVFLDLDIVLSVGGDIKGELDFKFVDGNCVVDPKVSTINNGVDLMVKGYLAATARVWKFEMSGGGQVGSSAAEPPPSGGKVRPAVTERKKPSRLSAELTPKGGRDPFAMNGRISFNGLAFYYLIYADIGASGAESEAKKKKQDNGFGAKPSSAYEKSGECVIMKPWSWP